MVLIIPAVLSTKQCHDYVGGSRLWNELLAAHPDLLRPIRTVPRGDSFWRRETVDSVLRVAEAKGSLIAPAHSPTMPILKRQGRRFKREE